MNLAQIATALNTCVHPASNEKRCHRFVKDFAVDLEDIARFILQGLPVRFELILDRTEHFFGQTSVNVLTFAACVGRVRFLTIRRTFLPLQQHLLDPNHAPSGQDR